MVRRFMTLALVVALGAPAGYAATQGPTARDLAQTGREHLAEDHPIQALDAFRLAREAVDRSEIIDRQLVDFLALSLYNLGVRFNNSGDVDRAVESFLQASLLSRRVPQLRDPEFRKQLVEATLKVADYLVASGRPERAVAASTALGTLAGGDVRPLLAAGAARMALGDTAGAGEMYQKAAEHSPKSAEAAAGMGRVARAAAERPAPRDGGGEEEDARVLRAREEAVHWLGKARDLETMSAQRESELAGALMAHAAALARSGRARDASLRLRDAEVSYRRAVTLDPTAPWRRIDLAMYLFERRRYDEASDHLAQAETILSALVAERPSDRNAGVWRQAIASCKGNIAAADYNLAVDALNRADFAAAGPLIEGACRGGPAWEQACASLKALGAARKETFERTVGAHRQALAADPDRAVDLLALGDLYAGLGSWDEALIYYERLRGISADVDNLSDRIAAVTRPEALIERSRSIPVPGGEIDLVHYDPSVEMDLVEAIEASWLRVTTALGANALTGALGIIVYPNQRAFRENAGYRVGALVKGNYGLGQISVYRKPSHTVLEWISVFTHEMTHHGVERLASGNAPRWFSEGVARFVQGDSAAVDRERLARRLEVAPLPPLAQLDDLMERSWNDPEVYLDALDASLLAVEEMAGKGGLSRIRLLLTALGREAHDRAEFSRVVEHVLGRSLDAIDAAWRARIAPGTAKPLS